LVNLFELCDHHSIIIKILIQEFGFLNPEEETAILYQKVSKKLPLLVAE